MPVTCKVLLGVHIHSVCLVCISMTFEPTGDTCALLLVGVACAFRTVSHGVRRIAKRTWKEFQDVSEVSNTSLNMWIWLW